MQANDMKSMFVVNGHPSLGVFRINSRSDLLSALSDSMDTSDDVGLTLRIDDKLHQSPLGQQEAESAVLNSSLANTNIDLSIPLNFDVCDVVSGNQLPSEQRDFFQAFLQPAPPTPAQSPPYGNEHCQSPNCLCKSTWLERQTSLSIALEVLGEPQSNSVAEDRYPPTPPSENQNEQYLPYPSPSYVEHISPLPRQSSRTRTVSDHTEYVSYTSILDENLRLRAASADNSSNFFDISFSPASYAADAESDAGSSSDKENQSDANSTADSSCTSTTTTSTTTICNSKETITPVLTSLPSFLKSGCENPVPADGEVEGSLDMVGMLQDFLEDSDTIQKKKAELAARIREAIATDHCYSAPHGSTVDKRSCIASSPSTEKENSSPPKTISNQTTPVKVVVDLTQEEPSTSSSTPRLEKSPSYIRRRSQNNRACRESRKKRKTERTDAETKVKFLAQDNEDMRKKIQELEVEVKETRALLISRMVNQ